MLGGHTIFYGVTIRGNGGITAITAKRNGQERSLAVVLFMDITGQLANVGFSIGNSVGMKKEQ